MFSRPMMIFVMIGVLPLLAFGQAKQQAAQSTEQQLTNLENEWNTVTIKRDTSSLARILGDDFTGIDTEGKVTTKAQALAELKSGEFAATKLVLSDMKVRAYGNTAVVTGINAIKAKAKGKDVSGDYRFTDVWVLRDGRWQCVASQGSKVAASK